MQCICWAKKNKVIYYMIQLDNNSAKNNEKHKLSLIEIGILLLFSLVPILWLHSGQVIIGHDSGFRIVPWKHLIDIFYTWYKGADYGMDYSIFKGFLITLLPEAIFSSLFSDMRIWQTATMIFWFFVMGFCMYIATSILYPSKNQWFIRLYASLLYMYNFFLLQGWFIVERAKFSLFAALPLVFVIYLKILKKEYPIFKSSIVIAFILFLLNGGGSPPLYGAILVVMATTTLFHIIVQKKENRIKSIIHIVKIIPVLLISFLLINAYWIFPLINLSANQYNNSLSSIGGIEGVLSWELMVNKYASIANLIRLQGIPDWYTASHPFAKQFFTNPFLIVLSFVPFTAIIFGLVNKSLRKKIYVDINIYFLLLLFIIGLFFASGSKSPLGFIYISLLKYFPGFAIFRSAFYKFGPMYLFGLILLSAIFFYHIITHYSKNYFIKNVLFFVILLYIPLYHFPFFSGSVFDWNLPFSTRLQIPSYVTDMGTYIDKNTDPNDRILLFPPLDSKNQADGYLWGFWSLDTLPRLITSKPIVSDEKIDINSALYQSIFNNDLKTFFQLSNMGNIKRILVRNDTLYIDKITRSSDFNTYTTLFKNPLYFTLEKVIGEWSLYSINNPNLSPYIYIPKHITKLTTKSPELLSVTSILQENQSDVIFDEAHSSALLHLLESYTIPNIIQADCIYCDYQNLGKIFEAPPIPSIRLLPDSFLYSLIQKKEEWTINKLKDNPIERIIARIIQATKRLVEIKELTNKETRNEKNDFIINDNIRSYESTMDYTIKEISDLDKINRNTQSMLLLSYLTLHQNTLSAVRNQETDYQILFEKIFSKISEYRNLLLKNIWISQKDGVNRYYLNITKPGEYTMFRNPNLPSGTTTIDGTLISSPSAFLNTSVHQIEHTYSSFDNTVQMNFPSDQFTIKIASGEVKKIPFPDINFSSKYLASLSYMVPLGNSIIFSLNQNNDEVQGNLVYRAMYIKLEDDGKWHEIHFIIKPNMGVKNVEFMISSQSIGEKESVIEFRNFDIKKQMESSVFFENDIKQNSIISPDYQYTQISPALYRVTIKNSVSPFVLTQKEQFSPYWNAYIINPKYFFMLNINNNKLNVLFQRLFLPILIPFISTHTSPVHGEINGLYNSWFIDNNGESTILLLYTPHIVSLIGLMTSIISLLFFSALYIRIIRHEKLYKKN
jgi:hypothetical protein